jgi:hypothetical protein
MDRRGTGRRRHAPNPSFKLRQLARHAFLTFGMPIKGRRDARLREVAFQGLVQHKYD